MHSGSCLCGAVRYEIAGKLGPIGHCHCRTCRKAHAAAFATTASAERAAFRWCAGEQIVASFESTPGKQRFFCPRCGSHLIAAWDGAADVIVRVGSLDTDPDTRPVAHIWTSLKAPWHPIADGLPQFTEAPPGAPRRRASPVNQWSSERPTVSGVYLYMDDLDTIAEEISTFDVDVAAGTVIPTYNLGTPPAPLTRFSGLWFGPIARV